MFHVQLFNPLAKAGLAQFPEEAYHISEKIAEPDAILVRSHDMREFVVPDSLCVVGRAGAGVNNIPLDILARRGVPVMNTPGVNTNAVRELVVAGMLLASRNLPAAIDFVRNLSAADDNLLHQMIERDKKQFTGNELRGKTFGVIGLGNIGVKVANAAASLGLHIIGYDPAITVKNAWELSSEVRQARDLPEVFSCSDFITLHVPLILATRKMINAEMLRHVKNGAVLLNFSRGETVDTAAVSAALAEGKLSVYVNDFPVLALRDHPRVISLPHLGASTREAEENCAIMIVRQVRNFLEKGTLVHAVNFPDIEMPDHENAQRLALVHGNQPGMVAQISATLAAEGINIAGLQNGSRNEIAYTLIDVNSETDEKLLGKLAGITGMIRVRKL
jgi:D-3-phosphoglycerate dehydrogenase / 2-oxoglutarate reductase